MSAGTQHPLASGHEGDPTAVLVVRIDDDGTISYAYPAAARLLGREVDELIGLSVDELAPDRFRADHRALRQAMSGEPPDSRRRTHRVVPAHIDGADRLIVVDLRPLAGAGDEVLATMQPLEAWVDATAWTRSAFEHSPTPIAVVELTRDGDRTIRAANEALSELLGYTVGELLGMSFEMVTFAEDEPRDRAGATAVVTGTSDSYVRRKRYRHRDGQSIWCDLSSRVLPNDEGRVLALAHLTDVSAQVELAELHRDTEERLRSEVDARTTALVDSEYQLRQSLTAASMASWRYDVADDRFALVADDRNWPELREGRTAADVLAMIHPDDVDSVREAVRAAVGLGRSFDITLRSRADLPRRWVRIAGDTIAGDDDRVTRVLGIVQDVTPIQALIDELRRSERQLSLSVQAARIGTWVTDIGRRTEHYDATTRAIFGLGEGEAITDEAIRSRVHPDDVDALLDAMRRVATDGTSLATTFRLGDADDLRWVQCWSEPVLGNDGSMEGIVGVVQDITADRELIATAQTGERLLREREDHLRLVLAATTTGTWDWRIVDGAISFSAEWLENLGYEDHQLQDRPWTWGRLIHPDDWPGSQRRLVDHFEQRSAFCESVHRLRTGDGSWRWHRTRGRVVERDEEGRPTRMIGADMDISDQRRLEDQLVHGAKMQALGAFAGSVAHDFNNVMAIVRGHVELLRDPPGGAPPDASETERRLAAIEQSVDRASSFVRQLMALGRPGENRPADIDLTAFVMDLAPTLAQFLGEDIALDLALAEPSLAVRIDGGRLEALLLNLAANARDAMASGGSLTITVRSGEGSTAVLEVADTGVGMDAATAAAAFEPFFTTKAPGVGTGLGLANALATVSAAGGSIGVRSAPGEGTAMTISLPLADAAPSGAGAGTVARSPRDRATVLLVEDETELLELTADAVRSRGHRVHTAASGVEALEILEAHPIDIVVTDAVMPEMNGVELAAAIAERRPDTPVLFVTGYAGDTAAPGIGVDDVLVKPVPHDVLVAAIEARLATTRS